MTEKEKNKFKREAANHSSLATTTAGSDDLPKVCLVIYSYIAKIQLVGGFVYLLW